MAGNCVIWKWGRRRIHFTESEKQVGGYGKVEERNQRESCQNMYWLDSEREVFEGLGTTSRIPKREKSQAGKGKCKHPGYKTGDNCVHNERTASGENEQRNQVVVARPWELIRWYWA